MKIILMILSSIYKTDKFGPSFNYECYRAGSGAIPLIDPRIMEITQ